MNHEWFGSTSAHSPRIKSNSKGTSTCSKYIYIYIYIGQCSKLLQESLGVGMLSRYGFLSNFIYDVKNYMEPS